MYACCSVCEQALLHIWTLLVHMILTCLPLQWRLTLVVSARYYGNKIIQSIMTTVVNTKVLSQYYHFTLALHPTTSMKCPSLGCAPSQRSEKCQGIEIFTCKMGHHSMRHCRLRLPKTQGKQCSYVCEFEHTSGFQVLANIFTHVIIK